VLFADLVGFTTLAEDRDPESTRELLTRYFDAARDAIERHGGTVEKFIGDAVMAVWGTPVAHEDDAERAVRAALELVKDVSTLSPQLQARAGVLSGEAAVTLGATNQGMVAGDLVNTAARLQGVAEPGTVLVGEPTMRAAERAVMFEEVGEHSLKGKLAPVPAWRAVRVVAQRGGEQRADALEPPFVGRDEELRLLKDQLHAPGRDQRARIVSITGPGAAIPRRRLKAAISAATRSQPAPRPDVPARALTPSPGPIGPALASGPASVDRGPSAARGHRVCELRPEVPHDLCSTLDNRLGPPCRHPPARGLDRPGPDHGRAVRRRREP
jgi:class 3 adenylate cyclase